jgi:glycosyltransferase involved in cell wall biosynthesis
VGPDDGYRAELEKIIKQQEIKNVIFTGLISDREKIESYVDADVFVTPSYSGFPVTFLEACACGLPIVTTDRGDELDWLDNRVGYVAGFNKEELAGAMLTILYDKSIRDRFSITGIEIARKDFNWDKIAKKFCQIYDSGLMEHKG